MKKIFFRTIIYVFAAFSFFSIGVNAKDYKISYSNGSESAENIDMYGCVVNNQAYSGNKSMYMYFNHLTTSNLYLTLDIVPEIGKIKSGCKYEFGFKNKCITTAVGRVYLWQNNNRTTMSSFAWNVPNRDWGGYSTTFTTIDSVSSFALNISVESRRKEYPAKVWIDDLYLYETDENGVRVSENLINDSGFEECSTATANSQVEGIYDSELHEGVITSTVKNFGGKNKEYDIFSCAYDQSGEMTAVAYNKETFYQNETKTIVNQVTNVSDCKTVKTFVLDNFKPKALASVAGVTEYGGISGNVADSDFDDLLTLSNTTLTPLMNNCNNRGIQTKYEKVNLCTIKEFTAYGKNDIANGRAERANYIYSCLRKLYGEAYENMNAYLSGQKSPMEVSTYVNSPNKVSGNFETALDDSGSEKKTFFVGYGHFSTVANSMTVFPQIGGNIVQQELNMSDCVVDDGNGGFKFKATAVNYFINTRLARGVANNVKVSLLLSVRQMPSWMYEKYPDIRSDRGYNVNHPKVREYVKTYIDGVCALVSGNTALHSICLTNEPTYSAGNNDYETPMFREFVYERYNGNIAELNHAYNTSYNSFSEISVPSNVIPPSSSDRFTFNKYYDYMCFNDKTFADFHVWLGEQVKSAAPAVMVHTKLLSVLGTSDNDYYRAMLGRGTDPELFSRVGNVSGCDGAAFFGRYEIPVKNQWYDMLKSFSDAPIINSEDHHIIDGSTDYSPEQAIHVRQDLWQGALHGRTTSVLWVWERTYNSAASFEGSILHRPDCVAAVGRTSLDLNRLSNEVAAVADREFDTAILYDKNSRLRNISQMYTENRCYEGAVMSGRKVKIVTENILASGGLTGIKTLIVPDIRYLSDEGFNTIQDFSNNGGSVYVVGCDSLLYDELGTVRQNHLIRKGNYLSLAENGDKSNVTTQMIMESLLTDSFKPKILLRGTDGQLVFEVEYSAVDYMGKTLVNICNYSLSEDKTVCLNIPGKGIDLISGGIAELSNFSVRAGATMLVEINNN